MDSLTRSERVLHGSLYCMTFVTGLVDAGSWVAMGHVFTANMIIALTALAMGMRNGTVRRLAVPELTTTVLTLTVAALAFDFSLTPGNNPRWRRRVGSVFMMLSGAFVGVQLLKHSLALLLGASAVLTALCALAQIYREETEHEAKLRTSRR